MANKMRVKKTQQKSCDTTCDTFIKKYTKLFMGIAAIILAIIVFVFIQKSGNLENAKLSSWMSASQERRSATVKVLTGTNDSVDGVVLCVNKITSLPDSKKMAVRDAVALCYAGIKLKESI